MSYESGSNLVDLALQARSQEIELFWKRALFFWGFIASAFVGYVSVAGRSAYVALVIACFGLVCSVAWSLVNRGSKYWQENWEHKVRAESVEVGRLFGAQFPVEKKGWYSAARFSVSRITIALSEFTTLAWIALIVREGNRQFHWFEGVVSPRFTYVAFVAGTLLYCAWMCVWAYRRPSVGNATTSTQAPTT